MALLGHRICLQPVSKFRSMLRLPLAKPLLARDVIEVVEVERRQPREQATTDGYTTKLKPLPETGIMDLTYANIYHEANESEYLTALNSVLPQKGFAKVETVTGRKTERRKAFSKIRDPFRLRFIAEDYELIPDRSQIDGQLSTTSHHQRPDRKRFKASSRAKSASHPSPTFESKQQIFSDIEPVMPSIARRYQAPIHPDVQDNKVVEEPDRAGPMLFRKQFLQPKGSGTLQPADADFQAKHKSDDKLEQDHASNIYEHKILLAEQPNKRELPGSPLSHPANNTNRQIMGATESRRKRQGSGRGSLGYDGAAAMLRMRQNRRQRMEDVAALEGVAIQGGTDQFNRNNHDDQT